MRWGVILFAFAPACATIQRMKVMRHIQKMILVAACSFVGGVLSAATTTAKVSLQDGSVLVGEPVKDEVKLDFVFGQLALKVVDIARIECVGTNSGIRRPFTI